MSEQRFNTANGKYEIFLWPEEKRGYFEHNERGDESAGELLFGTHESGAQMLIDYDGVAVLPKSVADALKEKGYVVGDEFY